MKHSTEPTSLDETCLLSPEQFVEGLGNGNYSCFPGYLIKSVSQTIACFSVATDVHSFCRGLYVHLGRLEWKTNTWISKSSTESEFGPCLPMPAASASEEMKCKNHTGRTFDAVKITVLSACAAMADRIIRIWPMDDRSAWRRSLHQLIMCIVWWEIRLQFGLHSPSTTAQLWTGFSTRMSAPQSWPKPYMKVLCDMFGVMCSSVAVAQRFIASRDRRTTFLSIIPQIPRCRIW